MTALLMSMSFFAAVLGLGIGFALGWRVRGDIPTITRLVPTYIPETESERRARVSGEPQGFELPEEPGK